MNPDKPIYPPFVEQLIEARFLLEKIASVEFCNDCLMKLSPLLQDMSNILTQSINEHEAKTLKSLRLKIAGDWAELNDYERLVLLKWQYLKAHDEVRHLQDEGQDYSQAQQEEWRAAEYIPVLVEKMSEQVIKIAYQWAKALHEEEL